MKPQFVILFLLGSFLVTRVHAAPAKDIFAENVRTTEPLSPEQEREKFYLPPGFKIQLVAAEPDLRKPMNMAFDSVGRLWVTESREYPFAATNDATARDTIRIFSNFDDNGRAQKVTTFATNLNIPIGLYPFRSVSTNAANPNDRKLTWKCVVWSIPNIYLLEDTDGDGIADKKTLLYGPFDTTRDTHGNQASFRRGLDGWIYATHGFNNQSCVAGKDGHEIFLPSGNIYRFKLDGSRIEHWTHGQVNPFGLCFDPLGNLYSADCHSSPIYQLLRGAHYPSFGRPHDGLGFGPTTIQHSHGSTAIAGIVYVSDPAWPAEYQNNIFIGNVMTSRINRDQITFTGSTSKGKEMPDFLSTDDPWFRPVDLQFGPDGALWVADFYNRIIGHYEVPLLHPGRDRERGRIWRIVPPAGADVRRLAINPKLTAPNTNLLYELASENPVRRGLALAELPQDRFAPFFDTIIKAAQGDLMTSSESARVNLRIGSLWLLQRADFFQDFNGEPILEKALSDTNPIVRCHALRMVADAAFKPVVSMGDMITVPPISASLRGASVKALSDPDPFVRRAAADALGAQAYPQQFRELLALKKRTVPEDTHLIHTVKMALRSQFRGINDFYQVIPERLTADDARELAAIAVGTPTPAAAEYLYHHLQTHQETVDNVARYAEHVAQYAQTQFLMSFQEFLKKHTHTNLDDELAVFVGFQNGFAKRNDGPLPPEQGVYAVAFGWRSLLSMNLLTNTTQHASWTYVPLNPDQPGRNPWAFEERNCADGQRTRLMSSFPHGETLTGVLRSPVFVLPKQLSFYLCGHDGFPGQPAGGKNHVRLRLVSDTDKAEGKLIGDEPPAASPPSPPTGERAGVRGQGQLALQEVPVSVVAPPPHPQSLSPVGGEGSQSDDLGRVVARLEGPAALPHPGPLPLGEGSCSAARGASRVEAELRWAEEGLWRPASLLLPAGEGWDEGEGIHNSEAYGVRCDGKGARPEESVGRPVGKVSRPEETVHRPEETMCLDSREAIPTGREAIPTGREAIPTGREVVPTGREVVPTDREVIPTGREVIPTGREAVPTRLAAAKATGALPKGVVREAKVPRNDTAQKITWDLGDLAGKRAVIEVTDGDEGKAYAWLAFGRFVPALPELTLGDVQSLARRQQTGADLARSLAPSLFDPDLRRRLFGHNNVGGAIDLFASTLRKLFAETSDLAVRAAAGRAWLAFQPEEALPKVEPLVRDAAQPESLRAELAAQLCESAEAGRLAVVVAALTNAPTRLQTKLGVALVSTPAGAEHLLAAVEAGRVPARVLQDRTLADRLGASPARDAKARLAALTKNLPPADAAVQLAIEARRKGFAPQQASAARGAVVFTKACAVCHQLGGQGALVGPQLDGIGGRGLERLLEDILDPNRNVDKAFRTTVYVLKDGETVSGLARREEGGAFIYALANGQEARVAKADVKERRETETSLMPANFAEALTAAELNDLLAFLLEHKAR